MRARVKALFGAPDRSDPIDRESIDHALSLHSSALGLGASGVGGLTRAVCPRTQNDFADDSSGGGRRQRVTVDDHCFSSVCALVCVICVFVNWQFRFVFFSNAPRDMLTQHVTKPTHTHSKCTHAWSHHTHTQLCIYALSQSSTRPAHSVGPTRSHSL